MLGRDETKNGPPSTDRPLGCVTLDLYRKLTRRAEVHRAYNQLLSAIESVRASEPLVDQARQALRLAQVRYQNQLGDLVDLNAAEAAGAAAEAQHGQSQYGYQLAEAALNYATGNWGQSPKPPNSKW